MTDQTTYPLDAIRTHQRAAEQLRAELERVAAERDQLADTNDTLALTLAEALGTLAPSGGGCMRGWLPRATVARWRSALREAEEARAFAPGSGPSVRGQEPDDLHSNAAAVQAVISAQEAIHAAQAAIAVVGEALLLRQPPADAAPVPGDGAQPARQEALQAVLGRGKGWRIVREHGEVRLQVGSFFGPVVDGYDLPLSADDIRALTTAVDALGEGSADG